LKQKKLCATFLIKEDPTQASVLKRIPAAYKEYESLFLEGSKNEALLKHQPWDHKISLESGKTPSFESIYQQSATKL